MFCCGRFVPLHTLSNRESAWHLIHLERDLERDPDLELEELRERDLQDKKETEPFQYFLQHEPQLRDLVVRHGRELFKLKKRKEEEIIFHQKQCRLIYTLEKENLSR